MLQARWNSGGQQEPGMLKFIASLLFCVPCLAQTSTTGVPITASQQAEIQRLAAQVEARVKVSSGDALALMEQRQIANLVAERQAQLRRDTEKLVALTAELKQHVDKAGVNILSMDVIKKAAEIQKLAKSVEEKMKHAY